jgi:hypothetical protein
MPSNRVANASAGIANASRHTPGRDSRAAASFGPSCSFTDAKITPSGATPRGL